MPARYVLHENHLFKDKNAYRAQIRPADSLNLNDVINRMLQRGSTVSKPDILGVLEDYHETIEALLREGNNIKTPLCNFSISIKGIFNGPDDTFDPVRHKLIASTTPGARLKKWIQTKIKLEKLKADTPQPLLQQFKDINSDLRNQQLTPGGMGELVGFRLKFDETDPKQGIFFLSENGAPVRAEVIGANQPKKLLFMVPDLDEGPYQIEVRAKFGDNMIRGGRLLTKLSVTK